MPPKPDNLTARVVAEKHEGGITVRDVVLEFGPGRRASLRVQVLLPPGKGPFPVFLTNHPRSRPWAATAVRRGYIGCIYFAADPMYGSDDDSDKFIEVYPEYDFSCLARWAWAGMRAVDYLVTLPQVDAKRIAISGHSRNGKQALIAAAFDERIGAVALSSGNTGEGTPWRYTTDMFANESIEQITGNFPHWFHPRLRFFAGREDKLPVDQNSLMSLVAPRGLLMASAFSEGQGAPFGFEQAYRSVSKVYDWLGAPQNIGLSLRAGEHPTTAGDIERYIDFFDSVFGRKRFPKQETWINGYVYSAPHAPATPSGVKERICWLLGDEPPGVRFPVKKQAGHALTNEGWLGMLFKRPIEAPGVTAAALPFGDDLKGDLYLPASAKGKAPAVIWLHPYSHATGYSRNARPYIQALTKRGFAVLCFDQIGYGTRVEHAKDFYRRYPEWSLMGKMVADTRAAVDALAALDAIDSSRIYVAGWALGAKVAVFTASLDDRVKGVASVAGFDSLRAPGKGTEGLRHYTHLHGLLPRLALNVPVDYDDILTAIAPRRVLVIAPQLDRYAPVENVKRLTDGKPNVDLETPRDFNRFPQSTQEVVWNWLTKQ
jgi:dienelactone hydrolase